MPFHTRYYKLEQPKHQILKPVCPIKLFSFMGGKGMLIYQEESSGQGLVEYALILLLIVLVLIIIVGVYGSQIGNMYSRVTNRMP